MDSKEPHAAPAGAKPESPAASESLVQLASLDREPIAHWLCTPERLEALALGWLFCEGAIAGRADVLSLEVESPDRVRVGLAEPARRRLAARRTDSGPGPAPSRIDTGVSPGPYRPGPPLESILSDAPRLASLFRDLFDEAGLRSSGAGGVHTGALFLEGRIVDVVEDVSRSAIIDKLVGSALLDDAIPDQSLFLLSGRISAPIAAKLARAGVAAAATISIPTTLAVDLAGRAGVALVGRARRDSPFRYGTA